MPDSTTVKQGQGLVDSLEKAVTGTMQSSSQTTSEVRRDNPEMDARAISEGLPHWRCVSARSNSRWRRDDGLEFDFRPIHVCSKNPQLHLLETQKDGSELLWDGLRDMDRLVNNAHHH